MNEQSKAINVLTDGTGVSPLTWQKIIKDAIADALLSIPAALLVIGVTSIPQSEATLVAATFAIGTVVIKAAYRAALRWATTT